jgi:hypothetical protein
MKVTLKRIEDKAMEDAAFWKKLRADPDRTLQENKLELSPEDYRRLVGILSLDGRSVTVDLGRQMTRVRRSKPADRLFWMGMWAEPGVGPTD